MNAFARNTRLAAYQSASAHGGVANADPHGLVLMLMDAAVQRMTAARGCLERGETVQKTKLLHSCVTMIAELRGSLNLEKGGPLAQNLSDLYGYMIRRLMLANAKSDVGCLKEVQGLLGEIRGAWAAIGPEVRGSAERAATAA
ncbi:MAG TPA: flagellar export chaperone FliS [Steroidobacteraceae bacterium]|nr:flagellar export chaperone FliS [Steroidobacteraceae bacterium]